MGNYGGFQKVKFSAPQRSTFDLSHDVRLSAQMGILTPVFITECVPSDNFRGSSDMLVRLAPLLAPIYDQIEVFVHYFFVPNRLLWDEWEDFITGGNYVDFTPEPATTPIPPYIDLGTALANYPTFFQKGNVLDLLGVPPLPLAGETAADYDDIPLDIMPLAAYQLIYMEYYRDRNFQNDSFLEFPLSSGEFDSSSGTELNKMLSLERRSYRHDYFTSALPWTQRGADVLIPLDGSVTYLQQSRVVRSDTGTLLTNNDLIGTTQDAPDFPPGSLAFQNAPNDDGVASRIENIDSISNATTTINDFRTAYALQVWLERNAVAGSRYNESNMAHFKVRSPDARLQRPEYIGGGRIPVKISEVVSTAYSVNADDDVVPLANMGGHGVTFGHTNGFKYFCVEHGFILGIMSIMNPPSYHQGMPRMFYRRRTFLEYPWPTFAKLGEQQVDVAEVYASSQTLPVLGDDNISLFGYQSRYADWKYICNTNRGDFHDTLLFWTMTRDFGSEPVLGLEFVNFAQDTQFRVFAVQDTGTDNFWIYCHNRVTVQRPLPYFGTPNNLGFV